MGVEYIQSNLTAGELTPELHARTDITKYDNGVAIAENMVILPHGGMRRRPGLSKITDTLVSEDARMAPFVFNTAQKYIVLFRPGFIDIYRDGVKVLSALASPYLTLAVIDEIDVIQAADTMIITHETIAPQKLIRLGSDSSWSISAITFTDAPTFNFGVSVSDYENTGATNVQSILIGDVVFNNDGDAINGTDKTYYEALTAQPSIDLALQDYTNATNWVEVGKIEPAWSATRGYPAVCTFHQNRLWLAGSTELPTTIWGSKTSGFFNFGLGTGLADDALADTLDTDEYNKITNIFTGRSLQVFTTGAEFYNNAPVITPTESGWVRQTGYGSKRMRPIIIDGATLFVDSSQRTIRQFLFDFNEDSYTAINLTLLSSHLVTNVKAMAAIKGTQYDVGDYVYVVNEDGTCAVLNTMRSEQITGWTHWTTDGLFKDVIVVDKDVYFLVLRNSSYFIEKLTEGTYTDHNVLIDGTIPTVDEVVHLTDPVTHLGDEVVHTDLTTGTPVTEITTDYDGVFVNTDFKVIADFSIMPDANYEGTSGSNVFTITRNAYRLEVGLNFKTKVETLPIASETQKGTTLHRRKRVVKVDINVLNSLGVYARNRLIPDRSFTVVLDKAPEPFTGFREMYLLGYDRLTSVIISQEEPLPFVLRGLGTEIAY
jgi:hypothetical protein